VILHAGLIALPGPHGWRGVLIEGPSGAGKSDLALRALDAGWALVADDRTLIWPCEARLYGRAPDVIGGLVEVRGLGVVGYPRRAFAEVVLVARCVPPGAVERVPDAERRDIFGLSLPVLQLHALEASAPLKLRQALSHLGLRRQPAYLAPRAGSSPPGAGGVP
jgi:serine kinase of HPr protein (carbohydrate metabolism regulator)